MTLKVSAASAKALVDVSEGLDSALLGINKASAEDAHKCDELKCILKAHSQLEVLSDEGVAVLASGNATCLIYTANDQVVVDGRAKKTKLLPSNSDLYAMCLTQ